MRKLGVVLLLLVFTAAAHADDSSKADSFKDPIIQRGFTNVPLDHWAYEAIPRFTQGMCTQYLYGQWTRWEFAAMTARALGSKDEIWLRILDPTPDNQKDLEILGRLVEEFRGEMEVLGCPIDRIDSLYALCTYKDRR